MIMENDVYEIPEKYKNMSASQVVEEKQKLFRELKSRPSTVKVKKTGSKRHVVFNLQ